MKKLLLTSILVLLVASGITIKAQNQPDEFLNLPGDNLNLYAVMNLFQKSETIEAFERSLNDQNSRINNLDLNGDNLVDYIMATDYVDGDVHTIVLQVALNRNEKQDVAVFTVQRFRNGSVQLQLIGDEALYGRNYIIEPIYDDIAGETPNPGYTRGTRSNGNITVVRTTAFEIAAWPMIRFIYRPDYIVWHSSWYWDYYPSYWRSWSPYYYHYYYGYHQNWYPDYYTHYRHWEHPRYTRYHDFYYRDKRSYSIQVTNRIKEGHYKNTYSRPEQRRDGEALYSKMHSDRNSTTSSGSSRRSTNTNADKSRTNPTSGQNSGTSRRSTTTTGTERTGTNRSSGQNADAPRRSTTTTTGTERTGTNRSSGQNADAPRRSTTTTGTERTGTNRSSGQNADAPRRSTTTVNERPGTNRSSGQNADAPRRSSGKPATSVSAPERRSQSNTRTETTVKRSDTTKEPETNKSSRRK